MKTLLYVKYARLEIDLMVHRGQPLDEIDALLSGTLADMAAYAQLIQKRGTWRQHEVAWPPLTQIAELLVPHPENRREALAELDQLRGFGEFTEIEKQLDFLRSYVATAIQVRLIRSDLEFCEFFIEAVENSLHDMTDKRLNHEEYVLNWIKWFTDNVDNRNLISKDAAYGGDMALVGGLRASWDLVARCANGDSPAFPLLLVHAAEREIRLDPDIVQQLSRIGSDTDINGEVEYEYEVMFETALRHFHQLTANEITTDEQEAFLHFGLEFLDQILAAKGDFTNDALDIEQKWQEIMGRQGPDLLSICEISTRFKSFQEFLSDRGIRNEFMARSYDIASAAMKRVGGYYDDLASQQYDFNFLEGDDANNLERLMKLAIKFRDDSQLKTEIGMAMSIQDMTERDLALLALPLKGTAREDLLKVSTYESLVRVFHESGGLDARRDNQAMLKFSSVVRDRLASYIIVEADTARANMDLEALQTLRTRLLAMKGNSFAGRAEEWPFFNKYQMYFRFFAAVPCTLEPDFVAEGFTGMLRGVVQFEIDTITVMAPIFPMLADAVDRTIALGDAADVASHLKGMDDIRQLLGQQDDAYLGLLADLWPNTAALVPENFHPGRPFRELFERELTYIRERLVAANDFTGRLANLEAVIAGAIADEDGFLAEQMGGLEKQDENFQSWISGHEAYGRMIAWLGTMARQDLTRHVGFVDLTKNAFGQDTGTDSGLAKYFAEEWAPGFGRHERAPAQSKPAGCGRVSQTDALSVRRCGPQMETSLD